MAVKLKPYIFVLSQTTFKTFTMKNFSLFAICFLILFSACQEKEEPFASELVGTWEKANIDASIGLEGVIGYVFRIDGTYTFQMFYREPGETQILGYLIITNGNFSSTAQQLILRPQESFVSTSSDNQRPYSVREQMVKTDFGPGQVINQSFSTSEGGQKLTLVNDSPQAEDLIFTKVD